jgi:hypothetical protein
MSELRAEVQNFIDQGIERAEAWALIEASDIDVTQNEFREVFRELQAAKNTTVRRPPPKTKKAPKKRASR